jgi:hypothetical protein
VFSWTDGLREAAGSPLRRLRRHDETENVLHSPGFLSPRCTIRTSNWSRQEAKSKVVVKPGPEADGELSRGQGSELHSAGCHW